VRKIILIITGGTIEKTYDEHTGELANRHSLVRRMLSELRLEETEVSVFELMSKDSLEMTGADRDRQGLIEAAEHGTLFLDEVGELSAAAQVRLLRFLQEGTLRRVGETKERVVEVRVIAATHRDLKSDGFREDLYFRLAVLPILLPPLRARGDDVLVLFGRALADACARFDRGADRNGRSARRPAFRSRTPSTAESTRRRAPTLPCTSYRPRGGEGRAAGCPR